MAIDLLNLVSGVSSEESLDESFTGFALPTVEGEAGVGADGVDDPRAAPQEFQGSFSQWAGVVGDAVGAGMGLIGLGASGGLLAPALAAYSTYSNAKDLFSYDPWADDRGRFAKGIDAFLGSQTMQEARIESIKSTLFGDYALEAEELGVAGATGATGATDGWGSQDAFDSFFSDDLGGLSVDDFASEDFSASFEE